MRLIAEGLLSNLEYIRHVYDPVDQFALVPEGMHAILAQTSTAAADYAAHPSVRAAGCYT